MLARLVLILTLWAPAALGQSFPERAVEGVTDHADLLPPVAEQRLTERLRSVRKDTGVEIQVLTLARQADWAPDWTLERFATDLFNHWGVGHGDRDDGVLVLHDDRAMRLELGAGYARDWDGVAREIVEGVFVPAFSQGAYASGVSDGVEAVIEEIVLPAHQGQTAPTSGSDDPWGYVIIAGFFGMLISFLGRHRIADAAVRLRRCPNCGLKGLSVERMILRPASTRFEGAGTRTVTCRFCDYRQSTPYAIAFLGTNGSHDNSSGGSAGSSSGGGGASGNW